MKEKLSSVMERFKTIGGFFKRNKIKLISAAVVFAIFAGWVCGTGIVKVEPQTVRLVKVWEPGSECTAAKPFLNESDKTKNYFSWPRVPGTDIGVKEEVYSLQRPLTVNTKAELFSLSVLTGNQEDAEKIVYLVISGNVRITDWNKFISAFNPEARPENKEKSRIDLLEEEIQFRAQSVFIREFFDDHFVNFSSRAYFAQKFAKNYNLKSPAEVEEFLKNQRPWYWALGPTYLKQLKEQVDRGIFSDSLIRELAHLCYMADEMEKTINDINLELYSIAEQKEILYEGFDEATIKKAESVFSQFVSYLENQGQEFPFVYGGWREELSDFLIKNQIDGVVYSVQEHYAIRILAELEAKKLMYLALKDYYEKIFAEGLQPFFTEMISYIDEIEFVLWRAAIQESFENPELNADVLRVDFYNQWLKTPGGMEYFKKYYWERGLFYLLLERGLGIESDLSFEIQEIEVPVK